jgi:transposase
MQTVTTIGLNIAKSGFQIGGIDVAGNVIVRCKLKRRYGLPFFQKVKWTSATRNPARRPSDINE